MNKILKYLKGKKGITLVWMAFMLAVLLMLAGMAIDIAYMYYVKNQLQVAADASALAGAPYLTGEIDNITLNPNVLDQEEARQAAWKFACRNTAAGSNVYLVTNTPSDCNTNNPPSATDLNGDNTDGGDIVAGHWRLTNDVACQTTWEVAGSGYFCRANGSTGLQINALQARPRRTSESEDYGMGPARVFIGQIFSLLGGEGWPFMSARASAIAALQPPPIFPLPICFPSCIRDTPLDGQWNYDKNEDDPILCTDVDGSPPGQVYLLESSSQSEPKKPGLAWTNFDINECGTHPACQNPPNKSEILPYLKGKRPPNICNKNICTTNGTISNLLDDVETEFNNKKRTYQFTTGGTSLNITGWKVLIPVVSDISCGVAQQSCPGAQGGTANPYYVERYATVLITEVNKTGQPGQGVRLIAFTDNPTLLNTTVTCKKATKTINRWITSFTSSCFDCNDPMPGGGTTVSLVK